MNDDRAWLEARILDNMREARENGYDLVCAECGCGIHDDSDMHDSMICSRAKEES